MKRLEEARGSAPDCRQAQAPLKRTVKTKSRTPKMPACGRSNREIERCLLACALPNARLFLRVLQILRIVRVIGPARLVARVFELLQLGVLLRACFLAGL